jgi:hypothetical protein
MSEIWFCKVKKSRISSRKTRPGGNAGRVFSKYGILLNYNLMLLNNAA